MLKCLWIALESRPINGECIFKKLFKKHDSRHTQASMFFLIKSNFWVSKGIRAKIG